MVEAAGTAPASATSIPNDVYRHSPAHRATRHIVSPPPSRNPFSGIPTAIGCEGHLRPRPLGKRPAVCEALAVVLSPKDFRGKRQRVRLRPAKPLRSSPSPHRGSAGVLRVNVMLSMLGRIVCWRGTWVVEASSQCQCPHAHDPTGTNSSHPCWLVGLHQSALVIHV